MTTEYEQASNQIHERIQRIHSIINQTIKNTKPSKNFFEAAHNSILLDLARQEVDALLSALKEIKRRSEGKHLNDKTFLLVPEDKKNND